MTGGGTRYVADEVIQVCATAARRQSMAQWVNNLTMLPHSVTFIAAESAGSQFPDQFWVPDSSAIAQIKPGMLIKVRVAETDDARTDLWDSVVVWITVVQVETAEVRGTVTGSELRRPGLRDGDALTVPVDRIFDVLPVDSNGRPGLNKARIEFGLGKQVLIGVTEIGPRRRFRRKSMVRRRQLVGVLSSVDPRRGIGVSLAGGGTFHLPPDGRALEEARPGDYLLRSTGETIENPAYLCTWTVETTARGSGISDTGYEI